MTNATAKLGHCCFRPSELYIDIVYRAGVKHQNAEVLLLLKDSTGNTKTLGDEIVVGRRMNQEQITNRSTKVESDRSDFDNTWEAKQKAHAYVPTVFALTEVNKD